MGITEKTMLVYLVFMVVANAILLAPVMNAKVVLMQLISSPD